MDNLVILVIHFEHGLRVVPVVLSVHAGNIGTKSACDIHESVMFMDVAAYEELYIKVIAQLVAEEGSANVVWTTDSLVVPVIPRLGFTGRIVDII